MAEQCQDDSLQAPRKKKPKRQCHFVESWTKDYKGIVKSKKGNQTGLSNLRHVIIIHKRKVQYNDQCLLCR